MNPPKNFIEIECPLCRQGFYSKQTSQVECLYCKSIIELDKDMKVLGYEPPEYHGTTVLILSVISLILLTIILIDALLSENTLDKLTPIGILVITTSFSYFWFPIRYGTSRKYGRFSLMIVVTLVLLLFLILNLGNLIRY